MAQQVKLTTAQESLLRAIQSGVRVEFRSSEKINQISHYWRMDTNKRCTDQLLTLRGHGLVKDYRTQAFDDPDYRLTEKGRAWPNLPQEEETTS